MTTLKYKYAFIILNIMMSNEAAKILAVIPTPSISHQVAFYPLTQELAKRGHEMVVITTDPAFPKGQAPAHLTEIDIHDISYNMWRDEFLTAATGKQDDVYRQMKIVFSLLSRIVEKLINSDEVQQLIQNEKKQFDMLLIEACARPALAFSHIFKVPVMLVSSFGPAFGSYKSVGAPVHPLLYPSFIHRKLYNLTRWEKFSELYNHYLLDNLFDSLEEAENEMLRRNFGPDFPTLSELYNNVHMMLINTHPIWGDNQPVPPSVVFMGEMHQKPEKQLPQDLKSFLDSSVNGVIYMSFGTNTSPSLLPPEKIQMFVNVFSRLPYDVMWKWDKDDLPGKSMNIKISKWFPQSDILRHPKIKLFITQGGLQSTDEAIFAGVPLIGIPMLGDQWYNVEKYLRLKIGLRLDIETLTEERLQNAVKTIIEDKSYQENVVRLRTLMRDQPQKPLERAIWWIEHVLRHGGARHLRAPAADMSWKEYLELDLVLTLILGLLVGLILVYITNMVFKLTSLPNFT